MTYRGTVKNGVVLLDEPAALPDGTAVDVRVASEAAIDGQRQGVPTFGSAKGLIIIADDFDAPLEDFREYMEPAE